MMYLLESLKAHHAECLLAFSEYHHRSSAAWLMNIGRGTRDCGVILMFGNGEILRQSH